MTSLYNFIYQVKRAGLTLSKLKKESLQREGSPRPSEIHLVPTSSPWDLLPAEVQVTIFSHCGVRDLLRSKLVCREFYQLLALNEHEVSRQYLRRRRHGTLPSPVDAEKTYTRKPEDDVVLLSDLFLPAQSAKGGYLYTFRYLHRLRRRQNVCSKLCYYLADRVMDRLWHNELMPIKSKIASKNERNAFYQSSVARILFHFVPLMYYVLYFLETYSLVRWEHRNDLLRDFEAGRLPVPIPPDIRKRMYRELQVKLLRSPPFTDTSTLVSTHHCMQLLVSYLRHTVMDEFGVFDHSWIASLLTVSPSVRIAEFFSAEIGDGGNQRTQRKDFMYNFHNDIETNERDDMNSLVFERTTNSHMHGSVNDVWFDVAERELALRNAAPHDTEKVWISPEVNIPILFGCQRCSEHQVGWFA